MLPSQEDVPGEHHLKHFKWNSPHIISLSSYYIIWKGIKKKIFDLNRKLIRWAVQKLLKVKFEKIQFSKNYYINPTPIEVAVQNEQRSLLLSRIIDYEIPVLHFKMFFWICLYKLL